MTINNENVALAFDALARSIDTRAHGSDGDVNGEPAIRLDFETADATHRVYIISTQKQK